MCTGSAEQPGVHIVHRPRDAVNGERFVRLWAAVARQAAGATASVAHACTAAVAMTHVDGAGVTVMNSSTARDLVHSTDRLAGELEQWQLTFGEGPCIDAYTAGAPVFVERLNTAGFVRRWPAFAPAALRSGAEAVFALPLRWGATRWGVLSLHRCRPGGLTAQELADALTFADIVAMLMLDEAAGDVAPLTSWQHDDPAAHHAEVHQATGMLVAQLATTAEDAFGRLRAYAYTQDRRISDVASDIVAGRLRLSPDRR